MSNPTCIELFAGAGGASLGLHKAGYRSLLAAEWAPNACETHRVMHDSPVFEGDVRKLDAELTFKTPPHLMWASPPCQAFSSAGKRLGAMDDRNGWPWTLDILDMMQKRACRPTWVICENVPGLTHHKGDCPRDPDADPFECPGCYWERWIIPEFKKRFAHVSVKMVDAADFGVPQRRKRIFLIAGPEPYQWPNPSHSFHNLVHDKWVTGAYWRKHGLLAPTKGPSLVERKLLESIKMRMGGPEEGVKPWFTVRDALGLGLPIRHQSPSAATVQRHPDDVAPSVSGKGTLYAEPEYTEGSVNPHYAKKKKGEVMLERSSGQGAVRPPRSLDEPGYTVRVQHGGGGGGVNFIGPEGDPLLEHPDTTFASQITPDPKHPEKSIDEPSTGIRGGGDGNDAPHYWLKADAPRVIGGGTNPREKGRPQDRKHRDITDEPSTTIATSSGGGAGNAGPWVEGEDKAQQAPPYLSYLHGENDKSPIDDVAPTIRAGGNHSGKDNRMEGGKAPYLVAAGDTEPEAAADDAMDFFDFLGDDEPKKPATLAGSKPELSDRPAVTVTTMEVKGTRGDNMYRVLPSGITSGGPDRASDGVYLATGRRRLTVEECAVLQGFPTDYDFQGTKTSQYKQVGNAVCPQVSEALARALPR